MADRKHLAAVAILLFLAAPILADEATDAFNSLYGQELKRVTATPGTADDVALAQKFLEAAGNIRNQSALVAILCDKAYELGARDPAGYPTALAAMALMGETVPARTIECLQKCAALHQRQYTAARGEAKSAPGEALIAALMKVAKEQDAAGNSAAAETTLRQALPVATAIKSNAKAAVQSHLAALASQQEAEKGLVTLKAKLEAEPRNAAVRKELVRIYLVEKDSPADAAKILDESLDEATRKYVPAALRAIDDAPELACQELGKWYMGLAEQAATPKGKVAMFSRSKAYYDRFLTLHAADDLPRTTAALALKQIGEGLTSLGAVAKPKSLPTVEWTDCLKDIDVTKAVGKWEKTAGGLAATLDTGGQPFWRITLPMTFKGGYDLRITLVLHGDYPHLNISLPAGKSGLAFIVENGGAVLQGYKRSGAPPDKLVSGPLAGAIKDGQECTLDFKMRLGAEDEAELSVEQDGRPFLHWKGSLSSYLSPTMKEEGPWPCLRVVRNPVTFRRVQFKPVAGKGAT